MLQDFSLVLIATSFDYHVVLLFQSIDRTTSMVRGSARGDYFHPPPASNISIVLLASKPFLLVRAFSYPFMICNGYSGCSARFISKTFTFVRSYQNAIGADTGGCRWLFAKRQRNRLLGLDLCLQKYVDCLVQIPDPVWSSSKQFTEHGLSIITIHVYSLDNSDYFMRSQNYF